jgi:DNA-directed RNA polymerase subunit RPC12/RpoP
MPSSPEGARPAGRGPRVGAASKQAGGGAVEPVAGGPLRIQLACPKCGGPFEVDDEVTALSCDHCGSLLVLSAPERVEISIAEERTTGTEQVLAALIRHRVGAERANIIARFGRRLEDGTLEPPPEALIQQRLEAFERQLRGSARLTRALCVYVPYWHITGHIAQGILGRQGDGPKHVRIRAFSVEHTIPAYDKAQADFRDTGLRMAAARVRPLTAKEVSEGRRFLPWLEAEEGKTYREIEKWRMQDLEPGVQSVTKHAAFLHPRRLLVYRSYWVAEAPGMFDSPWVMVDSGFETIAGYPGEDEVEVLRRIAIRDPLGSSGESFRKVHIVPSRCPDCGAEEKLDVHAQILFCPNCHLALLPTPSGIQLHPQSHAARGEVRLDGDYLPFWRFEFELVIAGKPVRSLEEYARAQFPQALPPAFKPTGNHLWIPARRLLGTQAGDRESKDVLEWIHSQPPAVHDGKLPLGGQPVLWSVSLGEQDARELARFALLGLHGKASAARLNTLLVKNTVQEPKLTLSNPRLVLVPFARQDDLFVIEGTDVKIPLLVVKGGPELDAFRVSVHNARSSGAEPGVKPTTAWSFRPY